jgi:hypothetical protein
MTTITENSSSLNTNQNNTQTETYSIRIKWNNSELPLMQFQSNETVLQLKYKIFDITQILPKR